MSSAPLWTPQAFAVAFQTLKDTGVDSVDAVAEVVEAMLRQYEHERQQLKAQLEQQNAELVEAQRYILSLERREE